MTKGPASCGCSRTAKISCSYIHKIGEISKLASWQKQAEHLLGFLLQFQGKETRVTIPETENFIILGDLFQILSQRTSPTRTFSSTTPHHNFRPQDDFLPSALHCLLTPPNTQPHSHSLLHSRTQRSHPHLSPPHLLPIKVSKSCNPLSLPPPPNPMKLSGFLARVN